MKILLINGCENHLNQDLENQVVEKLIHDITSKGNTYEMCKLASLSLKPCMACDACQIKTPGLCVIKDGLNELLKKYLASDLVIILTPIIFGTCNTLTKTFLDRTQPLYMPYQKMASNIMAPRYTKYPVLKFIGLNPNSQTEENAFKETFLNATLTAQNKKSDVIIIHKISDLPIHY